jgi:recombination protein RecT
MSNELTVPALQQYLVRHKQSLEFALPKHMNPERMIRLTLTAFSTNKALRECTPTSIFGSVVMASQMGLEIGVGGQGFLVPYRAKNGNAWEMRAQFIPGWQGLVDLAQRSGRSSVWTGAVFEGDEFDFQLGDSPFVKHKPGGESDDEKLTYVYAIGKIKDAESKIIEVWPIKKIKLHRDEYNKVGDRHYSFANLEMYARKVALLQVLKYMPKTIELANAIMADAAYETGKEAKMMGDVVILDGDEDTPATPPPAGADPSTIYRTEPRKSKAKADATDVKPSPATASNPDGSAPDLSQVPSD